jgi:hypothetical protein
MLYADGELDGTDEQAFEDLLARDESARDALCQAVQLATLLTDPDLARPDPAYRGRVRAKLLRRSRPARRWSAMAAAAVLLLALSPNAGSPPAVSQPADRPPAAPDGERMAVADDDEATVWAELNNSDHLEKARRDEIRRHELRATEGRSAPPDGPRRARVLAPRPGRTN